MADIAGQETAKRGIEIAAEAATMSPSSARRNRQDHARAGIGRHTARVVGRRSDRVTAIHSVAGALNEIIITTPPFRAPHHTSSYLSLVGGGATLRPGEVTLAHRGVLFMDEFPEFDRRSVEALREPLEKTARSPSRAPRALQHFPANIMLIAAMNPPGVKADQREIARFNRKLSGAIVDRIDLWIRSALGAT